MSPRWTLAIALTAACVMALVSLALGQSTSWDLRNYHWYNPYALLTGRLSLDVGVAHHATYYNPLLDIPLWWAGNALPAWGVALVFGFLHGLNFILLFLIARLFTPRSAGGLALALLLAAAGMIGRDALFLLGTSYGDNFTSLFVFAALYVLLARRETLAQGRAGPAMRLVLLAGTLAGLAVGAKLTAAPMALGILGATLALGGVPRRRAGLFLACGMGLALGFLIFGGWWCVILWRETGNPIFPYFNDIIGSPLVSASSYRDTRFLPASTLQALAYPFVDRALAFHFDYPHVALGYLALVAGLVTLPVRRASFDAPLFVFAALAYASWLAVFAVGRYLVPFEMLAPVLIWAALRALPRLPALAATGLALAALVITVNPPGERIAYTDRIVEVALPPIARPQATMALMTGTEPMAYVIPAFPAAIPFIRFDSYLMGPRNPTPLFTRTRDRILAFPGDLFLLAAKAELKRADEALAAIGLARGGDCVPVPTNLPGALLWCPVERKGPPPPG